VDVEVALVHNKLSSTKADKINIYGIIILIIFTILGVFELFKCPELPKNEEIRNSNKFQTLAQ